MANMFAGLFRKASRVPREAIRFPFSVETNPYRCKRTWPPDFSKLSQKHQFRLERRYRRRSKLKWARPNWTKGVKLAQWGSIVFVITYGVLFMQVDHGETPFDGMRAWYRKQTGAMDTSRQPTMDHDNSPISTKQPS